MIHILNIRNSFFEAVKSGEKTFEIRFNLDRGFQKGDTVKLLEIYDNEAITGNWIEARITYVCNFNQKKNFVVFSFKETARHIKEKQK